jgi:hypothetical protein
MQFANIEQIRKHRFVGNHYSDHAAFNAIESFVKSDSNSVKDKAEAIRIMSESGMGIPVKEKDDAKLIQDFLSD